MFYSRPTDEMLSFPHSSVGKESACNAGDPSVIPGSGRAAGEGIGYPLQYFWASLVAQLVNNPPAMLGTWVRSLGWEDPLEKEEATLKYFWASLVAQLVKNLPAVWETWVLSLGWEDPLDKEKAPSPVSWPGEFHELYSLWVPKELDTTEQLSFSLSA